MKSVYNETTGEIVGQYEVSSSNTVTFEGYDDPLAVIEGASNPDRHYVAIIGDTPTLVDRPTFPTFVESPVGTWTASGCLPGTEVEVWDLEINQLITTVTEVAGVIEITLADPGPYRFVSSTWPYLPMKMEVTA